jgi:glycine/D-amino acid oxidase-like deaminating enzyme
MPEITLCFPAAAVADREALAEALREACAKLDHVESAQNVTNRALVVDDVLLVLTVSGELFAAGAVTLVALKHLIDAAKGVGESLGVKELLVESRRGFVSSDALTESDAKAIAESDASG